MVEVEVMSVIVKTEGVMGLEDSTGGESKGGSLRKDSSAWAAREVKIITNKRGLKIEKVLSRFFINFNFDFCISDFYINSILSPLFK